MNTDKTKQGRFLLEVRLRKQQQEVSDFGLEKIPIEGLYHHALIQIGEQESYIKELEERLALLEEEIFIMKSDAKQLAILNNREAIIEARKNEYVKQLERTQQKQGKRIKKLKSENQELLNRLIKKSWELSKYQSET